MVASRVVGALSLCSSLLLGSVSAQTYNSCSYSGTFKCPLSGLTKETKIYPGGSTRCMYDADPWGYMDTNPTYWFEVHPGKNTNKNKVLIYFQAGGDGYSLESMNYNALCGDPYYYYSYLPEQTFIGPLNSYDTSNVFKDWTHIVVQYCTADEHLGNIPNGRAPTSPDPWYDPNGCSYDSTFKTYNNGYNNANTVVQWMFDNFPNPSQIAIFGFSAGTPGAQLWTTYINNFYKTKTPAIKTTVITDSTNALTDERTATHFGRVLGFFNACSKFTAVGLSALQTQCTGNTLKKPALISWVIQNNANVRFAHINAKADSTETWGAPKVENPATQTAYSNTKYAQIVDYTLNTATLGDATGTRVANLVIGAATAYQAQHGFLFTGYYYTPLAGLPTVAAWVGQVVNGPYPVNSYCVNDGLSTCSSAVVTTKINAY